MATGGTPARGNRSLAQLQPRCFADLAELTAALEARLERALGAAGSSSAPAVMLAGGNTPLPAYRALAGRPLHVDPRLVILYSDDRYVPSTSDASNYHQTRPLLDALALPQEQVLRVKTELPLEQAAAEYERALAALASRAVRIDLGLLGLGADGHTASLFTPADLERALGRLAIAVHRPDGRDAVSVTPAVLAEVAELVIVTAGPDKRPALTRLLARDETLTAWQAVSHCKVVHVWTEPQAWPGGHPSP